MSHDRVHSIVSLAPEMTARDTWPDPDMLYQGGQAIVGAIHQGGGAGTKIEEQPHAPAITHEPGATLPCPDPQRDTVPLAGGER